MFTKSLHFGRNILNRKLTCLFALLILISNISLAQTYVSGGIYSNTTWTTAGSPYIVTDTVMVFEGITLTIQPGVVVKFNDSALIDVEGNLYANGNVADSIIFTSNSATPYAGIYQGIIYEGSALDTTSYRYCRFSFASMFELGYYYPVAHCSFISDLAGTGFATYSYIDTCIFKYDTIGIYYPLPSEMITGCVFNQNGTGISEFQGGTLTNCSFSGNNYGVEGGNGNITYCTFDSNKVLGVGVGDCTVSNCIIKYNGIGIGSEEGYIILNDISDNQIGIETYADKVISCNTICSNTQYNIVAEMNTNESVSGNYWCLTDSAAIQATIYDAYQDISLGFAYFTPFDIVPCTHLCDLTLTTYASSDSVCAGNSTMLICNVSDSYTSSIPYWTPGNYYGSYYVVMPTSTTTYTVFVNDSNGCSQTDTITVVVDSTPTVTIAPIPTAMCPSASPITLSGTPAGGTFSGAGVYGNTFYPSLASGETIITYSYSSGGCTNSASDTTTVGAQQPPPSICYVTTDTSGTFNSVLWQNAGIDTLSIDSIIIYRQNVLSNYVPIGEVSVHAHTIFNDYSALPLVEPYFYALGVTDTCGTDTLLSAINETVFLQSSIGTGPDIVNLDWNFYQGNTVDYYRILRDDSGTGDWHAIDSVQNTINAFSDRNAPINPKLRYMVNTAWSVACSPFLVIIPNHSKHYVFNKTEAYSNMTYLFPTGIANVLDNNSINVFPNPVNNALSISFDQDFAGAVTITDVLGQQVYTNPDFTSEKGTTQEIDFTNFKSGMYIITLQSGGAIIRKKIIKM